MAILLAILTVHWVNAFAQLYFAVLAALACLVTAGVTLWHLLHPGRSMIRPR